MDRENLCGKEWKREEREIEKERRIERERCGEESSEKKRGRKGEKNRERWKEGHRNLVALEEILRDEIRRQNDEIENSIETFLSKEQKPEDEEEEEEKCQTTINYILLKSSFSFSCETR